MTTRPNLFLIGAPKSGTTSLAAELAQHPEIYLPSAKEPRFYDADVFYDDPADYPLLDQEAYLNVYSEAPENVSYWLDGSVFVMYSLDAVERILTDCPGAKFIVMLRDPLSASQSMHSQRLKTLYNHLREVDDDFYTCFDLLNERIEGRGFPKGCRNQILFRYDKLYSYDRYIPALIERLGEQLLVLQYSDYVLDAAVVHTRTLDFLELDGSVSLESVRLNTSATIGRAPVARFLYGLANLAYPFRSFLKPLYAIVRPLKAHLLKPKILKRVVDPKKDDLVRAAFASTYDYLGELKVKKSD